MSYTPDTIAQTVSYLNRRYFLPAIQREYVWKPEQVVRLFDSILRGYPISTFLFWSLQQENRERWDVYKFIDAAHERGVHNEPANLNGVQDLMLVLDGQQRLTSLLVGLKGSFTVKKKHKRKNKDDSYTKQSLYLDLLHDPVSEDDGGEDGIYYGLQFRGEVSESEAFRWFPVGRILDFTSEREFESYRDAQEEAAPDSLTQAELKLFKKNLERLYRAIHKDQVIAYYTETDQDYDRVLDIFVRANDGGTKLSKSDLLLSMVTASWASTNAREEIFAFVEHLNRDLTRKNDVDKDFIMKSCLVLCGLEVKYKVANFTKHNLDRIEQKWPDIKSAIERSMTLVNSFGIDRDNLTSFNAVIPVCCWMHQRPGVNLLDNSARSRRNAERIRRWLVGVLLNGVFGRAADTVLKDARDVLNHHAAPDADFPAEAIDKVIEKYGRTSQLDNAALEGVLDLEYGERQTFLALSLLFDEASWGNTAPHVDHLHPRSGFIPKELKVAGRSDWLGLKDRLGNLTLLNASENSGKNDSPFGQWLTTRSPEFLTRHLIPADRGLWSFDRFPEFVAERERMIRERLSVKYAASPTR